MKIPLKNSSGASLRVSPDLKTIELWQTNFNSTYGESIEYRVRELDEFESDFVVSTLVALTSQMQDFFKQ